MWQGGFVNLEMLVRICNALDCGLDEEVELVPDGENTDGAQSKKLS
jgi:DNA-binding Xre family transcriptional regulator